MFRMHRRMDGHTDGQYYLKKIIALGVIRGEFRGSYKILGKEHITKKYMSNKKSDFSYLGALQ